MDIFDFSLAHIPQAGKLAWNNYLEQQAVTPALSLAVALSDLTAFAKNGLGVVAFEGSQMVGFLAALSPFDHAFTTTARGTFSPIHAHGAVAENSNRIYKELYRAAGKKWAAVGISSHAIGLYTRDTQAIDAFFTMGFGLRCVDAIRPMTPIFPVPCPGYDFAELQGSAAQITPLRKLLAAHLGESPSFMNQTPQQTESWIERVLHRNSRIFTATQGGKILAFMEVMDEGENFATITPSMGNICGAFCLPAHRGKGLYSNLLNFAIHTLQAEGLTCLGVDFESINLTANGFWRKYFTAYTYSVVRRIDESALPLINHFATAAQNPVIFRFS